jgi:hypothetical protein
MIRIRFRFIADSVLRSESRNVKYLLGWHPRIISLAQLIG